MKYELKNQIEYPVVQQIFINRGFKLEDIAHYLNVTKDDLLPASLLDNIAEGAKMIAKHLMNKSKIFIQVDSDADGYTSAALLINYLLDIAPSMKNNIVYRLHDGKEHGIILDTIPEDIQFLITPDSASNNIEEHKALKEKGIDILVLDHHDCDEMSDYACVVNNQTCNYPNKTLSGVGIVYKMCCFIDSILGEEHANNYLDLAALGIVSDMMPVTHPETRYIIQEGFNSINNPFFKKMCKKNEFKLGVEGEYSPQGISFYITPYINAMVRSGTQEQKEILFRSMLNHDAETLIPSTKRGCRGQKETVVEQAVRTCVNVKKNQDDSKKEQVEIIEQIIEDNKLNENKLLIVPLTQYVDKNLVGLIANQLMGKYKKPTILLNKYIDVAEDGTEIERWSGSARNVERSKLENFRKFVLDSGLAQFAEGHASAFGTSFTPLGLIAFTTHSNELLEDMDFSPVYKVDFIFNGNTVTQKDILDIADLKLYWGQDFEESLIAIENIRITNENLILMSKDKNPTLKIILPSGIEIIKFGSSEEEYDLLLPDANKATYITLVGTCGKNEWMGNVKPQISIKEYEINEIQYDF